MKHTTKFGIVTLLFVVAMITTVSAGGITPYELGDGTGTLNIWVLCQHNAISKEMTIQRVDVPLPKPMYGDEDMIAPAPGTLLFVNGNTLSKDAFDKFPKVGEPRTIELGMSGAFDDRYAPGVFGVTLLNGNGGQPEYAIVSIYEGGSSYIHFIGHAVSMGSEPESVCYWVNETTEIYHSEMNHTVYIGEVNHTVYHPEVNHTVHHDATTIQVYHPEVNHTVHHDAVTHDEFIPEVNHTVHHDAVIIHHDTIPAIPAWDEYFGDYKPHSSHYDYVGLNLADYDVNHVTPVAHDCGDYDLVSGHYVYNHNHGDYDVTFTKVGHAHHDTIPAVPGWDETITPAYDEIVIDSPARTETVIDQPAYDEIVVDEPAYYETVIEQPAYDEIVVDQPAYDEIVVDREAWTEIIEAGHWICDGNIT